MQDLPPFSHPVSTALQSYALFPHMAVAQSIGLCLELQGKPKAEVATITVERMRARVKLPSGGGRRAIMPPPTAWAATATSTRSPSPTR